MEVYMVVKALFCIVLAFVCVGCASKWDVGSGSAEVRKLPDPE